MLSLLDPKLDYIFKNIFGVEKNKKLLISLLNAILRDNPHIKDVTLENTEISKILEEDKASRLDVRAKTDAGIDIDIEIQCRNTGEIPARAFHYLANMMPHAVKSNESYKKANVMSIWILGENVTDRVNPISDAYMTFQPNSPDPYQVMTDNARIIFIELEKFNPITPNLQDMLTAWLMFLKDPVFLNDEYLKVKEVKEAMDTLKYISSDDEVRAIADLRERTLSDKNSELTVAREQGLEEGREIGIEEGREIGEKKKTKEAVINMNAKGLDNKFISECLGITEEEVEEILRR